MTLNYLRAVAEAINRGLTRDKPVLDSHYYREGVSYGLTPEQWLIARKLPEIYQKFFGAPPSIIRPRDKDGQPYGDGLKFLMWCLKRSGCEFSAETVTSYYFKYRIGSKPKKRLSDPM